MRIGGVNFEDGKILNLVLESVPSPPTFDSSNSGEFTFSLSDRVLRFNDGEKLIALNKSISEDPNLKASLGSNWLNTDLTFDPSPFNDLPGITGLNSNDNLFNVIDQITTLIDDVSTVTLGDIDVPGNSPNMGILTHLEGDILLLTIEQILEGSAINLTLDNLSGFDVNDTSVGFMLMFNNDDKLVSRKVHFKYENLTSGVNHLINHGLNNQFCSVFCVNPLTNQMVIPDSIDFISDNTLVVNLSSEQPLIAFVTNFEYTA